MENLQSPAFPLVNQEGASLEDREVRYGLSKLEYAAILIAQGFASNGGGDWPTDDFEGTVASQAVKLAKAEGK